MIREKLEEKILHRSWLGTLNVNPDINETDVLLNYFHDFKEWYGNGKMRKRKLT